MKHASSKKKWNKERSVVGFFGGEGWGGTGHVKENVGDRNSKYCLNKRCFQVRERESIFIIVL